ncbi:hypothetical protein Bhyg_12497, partial [Pseudolycoriella hygida]
NCDISSNDPTIKMENFKMIVSIALVTFAVTKISSKELYDIHPKTMICKILDKQLVAKFTCKSKNLNSTANIGSKELIFQPGVVITNAY